MKTIKITKYTDGKGNIIVINLPQIKSKYTKALEIKEAVSYLGILEERNNKRFKDLDVY